MATIISLTDYQTTKELKAAVGFGRNLALNNDQTTKLKENPKAKVIELQNKMQAAKEPMIEATQPLETETIEAVIEPTINIEETPVVDQTAAAVEIPNINEEQTVIKEEPQEEMTPEEPVIPPAIEIEPVIVPTTEEEANVIEEPIIENTVLEPSIEIVEDKSKNQEFEQIISEISQINEEYDKKIIEINKERAAKINEAMEKNKNKIIEQQEQILDLKNRAEEHLKNAQAAEQIATIAHQNAQNIAQSENNDIFI